MDACCPIRRISREAPAILAESRSWCLQSVQGQVIVQATASEHVTIQVRDTGFGIPPEDLPRLFQKFYRINRPEHMQLEGTGLGLSIVKTIVEQHGGTISVDSELGKGSVFTIALEPVTRARAA